MTVGGPFLFRLRDRGHCASTQARGAAIEEQIVTVTSLDAAASGATAQLLAAKWAANLNAALTKL